MANNIDVKFSGLVELRATGYKFTGTDGPDCFRAVHTNFFNSAYVYSSSEMSATSITTPQNAFDRDLVTTYASWSSIRYFSLLNYRFRPHSIVIDATTNFASNTAPITLNVLGFDESNSFTETISDGSQILPGSASAPSRFVFNDLQKKHENLRRGWCNAVGANSGFNMRMYQLFVYGEIIHDDELKLPGTTGATTIESFSDSFVGVDPLNEGSIIKDGSLILNRRRAHTIQRETLASTFTIPDDSEFNVWNFDPNGDDRIVNLPRAPQFNHYLRINNIDGGFQLAINDSDQTTLIQNLSNADGPNTLEAVWANDQWIITT